MLSHPNTSHGHQCSIFMNAYHDNCNPPVSNSIQSVYLTGGFVILCTGICAILLTCCRNQNQHITDTIVENNNYIEYIPSPSIKLPMPPKVIEDDDELPSYTQVIYP